eukprot:CAMPEP_0174256664 /NCGR_PEP_ID=MMETSP0439-20130205/5878_1 /TAXON_ID=0 /ORGANISM="Stereomyxa ramosa, Strain Chinc5" /LENGTH=327 /DNA_ID=CAMNT_0015339381 /DNA_START=217 /DNA_END=1197 /DNA_ORIENTATION=-
MVATFWFAFLTQRAFFIQGDISKYFVAPKDGINWTLPSDISFPPPSGVPFSDKGPQPIKPDWGTIEKNYSRLTGAIVRFTHFQGLWDANIFTNPNLQSVVHQLNLENIVFCKRAQHVVYKGLFSPTEMLRRKIAEWQTQQFATNAVKIGIQIRSGGSLGWGRERIRTPNYLNICFLRRAVLLEQQLRQQGLQKFVYFITGDKEASVDNVTQEFVNSGRKIVNTRNLWGPTVHSLQRGNQEKTYGDFEILCSMDYLLITHSGYAEGAARSSCKPSTLLVHRKYKGDPIEQYPFATDTHFTIDYPFSTVPSYKVGWDEEASDDETGCLW